MSAYLFGTTHLGLLRLLSRGHIGIMSGGCRGYVGGYTGMILTWSIGGRHIQG